MCAWLTGRTFAELRARRRVRVCGDEEADPGRRPGYGGHNRPFMVRADRFVVGGRFPVMGFSPRPNQVLTPLFIVRVNGYEY